MNVDAINACFEVVGSVLVWRNVSQLRSDREVRGVDWRVQGFWAAWNIWNLPYYLSVGHPLSAAACAVLASGNVVWTYIAATLVWGSPIRMLIDADRRRSAAEAKRMDP